jgi:tetratricopeptide (TPR) repeat protein
MQLSKIKLVLFALGMFVLGGLLGAFARQKLAITLGGISSEAKIAEAGQALDRNDLAHAESLAFDAIPLDPESYLPYQELGEIFSRRNETAAAINAYSRAVEKLNRQRGHYHLLQLDATMKQTELSLLREKIAKLKGKA